MPVKVAIIERGVGVLDYEPTGQEKFGVPVLVPLRENLEIGVVVGFSQDKPPFPLKRVRRVLWDRPLLTEDLWETALFVKRRYLCGLSSALKVVLPPFSFRIGRVVRLIREPFEWEKLGPKQRELVDVLLASGGEVEKGELIGYSEQISTLARRGILTVEERVIPPKVKPKVAKKFVLVRALPPDAPEPVVKLFSNRKEVFLREARRLLGNRASYLLRKLARQGVVEEREEEVLREEFIDLAARLGARNPPKLTSWQRKALDTVTHSEGTLIFGVTGSGKTEVYMRAVERTLEEGKSAIVLVPEISLTPQMVARFWARFGRTVAVWHSALSPGERYDQWRKIISGEKRIVIGARSAIFAPVRSLGLIVVDEEQDPSYKQESEPRYHAREVALFRARICGAKLIMGSATPSLETYRDAKEGRISLAILPERVVGRNPETLSVDMRGEKGSMSPVLLEEVEKALRRGSNVILFVNRRGFAPFVYCKRCGYVARCRNCDVTLTYHKSRNELLCHYCGYGEPLPERCPNCGAPLRLSGAGTEKIEEEIRELFNVGVARLDRDVIMRKGKLQETLLEFQKGVIRVLVGTVMVTKGLDFPNVGLVGVLSADQILNFPDFRACEKTFDTIVQVAGRAGRGVEARVIVQTYNPDHYAIRYAVQGDFEGFAFQELRRRKAFGYPPFVDLARVVVQEMREEKVKEAACEVVSAIRSKKGIKIYGPVPAPITRLYGEYRYHIIVKGRGVEDALGDVLPLREKLLPVKVTIDVNPYSML